MINRVGIGTSVSIGKVTYVVHFLLYTFGQG